MLVLVLSLVITGLLLALPIMTWSAFKIARPSAKALPRWLAACTIIAWAAQALRYLVLASAQGPLEVRQAAHFSAPLGWLAWLAALAGVTLFIVSRVKKSSV